MQTGAAHFQANNGPHNWTIPIMLKALQIVVAVVITLLLVLPSEICSVVEDGERGEERTVCESRRIFLRYFFTAEFCTSERSVFALLNDHARQLFSSAGFVPSVSDSRICTGPAYGAAFTFVIANVGIVVALISFAAVKLRQVSNRPAICQVLMAILWLVSFAFMLPMILTWTTKHVRGIDGLREEIINKIQSKAAGSINYQAFHTLVEYSVTNRPYQSVRSAISSNWVIVCLLCLASFVLCLVEIVLIRFRPNLYYGLNRSIDNSSGGGGYCATTPCSSSQTASLVRKHSSENVNVIKYKPPPHSSVLAHSQIHLSSEHSHIETL